MINQYNLRTKMKNLILPEVSHKIGKREKIAAIISPEPHYTITMQENGSYDTELTCLKVNEKGELIPGCFYQGKTPKEGEILKLNVFIPGITSGMNYGNHLLPVKKVKKMSKNLDEVIVDSENVNWNQ
ncbi:MAG: hypothetical protein ABIE36_02365 [Candidatus Diapherotrites archaeon]